MWQGISNKYSLRKSNDFSSINNWFFNKSSKKLYKKYNFNSSKYKLASYSFYSTNRLLLQSKVVKSLLSNYYLFNYLTYSVQRSFVSLFTSLLSLYNLKLTNYTNLTSVYKYLNINLKFLIGKVYIDSLMLYFFAFKSLTNKALYNINLIRSSESLFSKFFTSSFVLNNLENFYVIYVKVSSNNVFITLTKNGSDVLLSLSGGQTSSKKKKTTLTVFFLLSRVMNYLIKNNINVINFLIIKSSWYRLSNTLLAPMKKKGIVVQYIGFDFLRSHNGLRKRKLRRL